MKMNKIVISLILVLTMFTTLITSAAVDYGIELKNAPTKSYNQTFTDVPKTHWAFSYIGEMVERGVLSGYPDGKFRPDNTVTRAEFSKIMVSAADLGISTNPYRLFADVPITEWYNPYVNAACPYFTAYDVSDDGYLKFKPDADALREDIAVALVSLKAYDINGADLSILKAMFTDYESISSKIQPYVATAIDRGLMSGYDDGTFRGQASITRAEAATLLWRAYQYGSDDKVVEPATTVKPTATPEPTKTPKPTAKATVVEDTEDEDVEPVESEEPVESAKPYITSTLVKNVDIEDVQSYMTQDEDGNVIYYNKEEKKISSVNSAGETSEIFNCEGFECVYEDITYTRLIPTQVFYDDVADRLLVVGTLAQVDDGLNDVELLSMVTEINKKTLKIIYGYQHIALGLTIYDALSDGTFLTIHISSNGICIGELFGGTETTIRNRDYVNFDIYNELDGNIYELCSEGLNKYDFSEFTTVENMRSIAGGLYDNTFYGWNGKMLYSISDTGRLKEIINTDEDVKIGDLKPISIKYIFFLTDDTDVIFYDNNASAIRLISKQ